jgi:hypothetical protein
MSDRDYYEVLGLTPRADGAMVDQSYWHLARKYQSLATTNAHGRRLLDELNEAYGVLGNPRLRHEYDAFRDDVLVAGGVIGPVRSKPQRRLRASANGERPLPRFALHVPAGWKTYALAAAIAVTGAVAAAALGAVAIGMTGLGVAIAVAALPAVRSRIKITMPELSMPSLSLPSIPLPDVSQIAMPDLKATKVDLARISENLSAGDRAEPLDPDELHASTAAIIGRWRKSMGLRVLPGQELSQEPSTALVDIVEGERQIDAGDADSEPLTAVIDILRGAHKGKTERVQLRD